MSIVDRNGMAEILGVEPELIAKLEPQGLPVLCASQDAGAARYDTVCVIDWWIRFFASRARGAAQ